MELTVETKDFEFYCNKSETTVVLCNLSPYYMGYDNFWLNKKELKDLLNRVKTDSNGFSDKVSYSYGRDKVIDCLSSMLLLLRKGESARFNFTL